jgi:hypothetical protein
LVLSRLSTKVFGREGEVRRKGGKEGVVVDAQKAGHSRFENRAAQLIN